MNKKNKEEIKRHTKILRDLKPNTEGLQKFPFSKSDEIENRVRNLERKVKEYDTPDVSDMPIPKKPTEKTCKSKSMTKKEFDERLKKIENKLPPLTNYIDIDWGVRRLKDKQDFILDWIREQLPDE
jgi:hypothetical protein